MVTGSRATLSPPARQFTEWLSLELGVRIALPTEPQWEFAASSRGRYRFPWGDDFDPAKANTIESGVGRATEASVFAAGFTTGNVKKTYETFKSKGVEITDELTERDYGTDFGIRDPFGNQLRVVQLAATAHQAQPKADAQTRR